MSFAENSRSFATLVASFPVSFWIFYAVPLIIMTRQKHHTYLDMGLDLHTKLLQVLNNGTVNRTAKVGMLISNSPRFIPDLVVYILKTYKLLALVDRERVLTCMPPSPKN